MTETSKNILLINTTSSENRVALIEDTEISEFHIESNAQKSLAGNIYKAKVLRVLPGMQAAFVDIGQNKAAFLYVSDIYNQHQAYMQEVDADLSDTSEIPQSKGQNRPPGNIEEKLYQGQEIIVQILKDAIATKGARVTSHISIPGRFLVHMPTFDHIGVSRRITDNERRNKLYELISDNRQPGTGVILRTASQFATDEQIIDDLNYLSLLWRTILQSQSKKAAPILLYEELDLPLRSIRDMLTDNIEEVIIDSKREFERIYSFVEKIMPQYLDRIKLYNDPEPLFDAYGVEVEITRALSRKVWLKSGGYLIIDSAEALTAIDVNTGKYTGEHSLEDTILMINLEAVKEIVYQLKLRNIGGIIIIDFIDLERASNRQKLFEALQQELQKDRAKTNILKISELGLVEMTRKRTRESIAQTLCEPCYYCNAKGYIKQKQTVVYEILRELKREAMISKSERLNVYAHPHVAQILFDIERISIENLEIEFSKVIDIRANTEFHPEHFEIIPMDK